MTPVLGTRPAPVVLAPGNLDEPNARGGKGGSNYHSIPHARDPPNDAGVEEPPPPLRLSESTAEAERRRQRPLEKAKDEVKRPSPAALEANAMVMAYLEHHLPPYWEVLEGSDHEGARWCGGGQLACEKDEEETNKGVGMSSEKSSARVGVFCLFDIKECRYRLQRMVDFVNAYRQEKARLLALAEGEGGKARLKMLLASTLPKPTKPIRGQRPSTGKRRGAYPTAALEAGEGNSRKLDELTLPSPTTSKAIRPPLQISQSTPTRAEEGSEKHSLSLSPLVLPHPNSGEDERKTPNRRPHRGLADEETSHSSTEMIGGKRRRRKGGSGGGGSPPHAVRRSPPKSSELRARAARSTSAASESNSNDTNGHHGDEGEPLPNNHHPSRRKGDAPLNFALPPSTAEGNGPRSSSERKQTGSATPGSDLSENDDDDDEPPVFSDKENEEDAMEGRTGTPHGIAKGSPQRHFREKQKKSGRWRRRWEKRMANQMECKRARYDDVNDNNIDGVAEEPTESSTTAP
ncbi:unnamed protein product [Phytomonas sp. Hart1]|nr:unnamed protein product [Phytomonas sp. Hart1]|eukprot:CCW67901.1 unnamed protein product [Phytomonas sp. isolate Hart1]